MAEEAAPVPAARGHVQSWVSLITGFSFVATIAVLAAILTVRFIQSRPVNIEEPSAKLASVIEHTLTDNLLPHDAVKATSSVVESDDGRWTHSNFQVTVPPRLDVAGITQLLTDRLRGYNLTITDDAGEHSAHNLKVWLSNYEVATIALAPAPEVHHELADWRPETRRLALQAQTVLDAMGIPAESVFQDEPETREDEEARWDLARFEVRLPNLPDASALATAIETLAKSPEVAALAGITPKGGNGVLVNYNDRTAIELELIEAPAMPGPLATVPMDSQPDLFRILDTVLPPGAGRIERLEAAFPAPMPPAVFSLENMPPRDSGEGDGHLEVASLGDPPGPRSKQDVKEPRVAIILDDGGYGGHVTEKILALDKRLTLAILPNTPDGKTTSARAKELGFEVMLHMPMQTGSATVRPFPGQINIGMPREKLAELTTDAMNQVPEAVGVNNHTGSRYTRNSEAMAEFLETVKAKKWFFIDSVTTAGSKAFEVARDMGIPSARRDIFLDDVANSAEIRRQWAEMVRIARKTGTCIAIGHFRPLTIEVLTEELPKLEAAGVKLVHASELVK